MQAALFDDLPHPGPPRAPAEPPAVGLAPVDAALAELAAGLQARWGDRLYLGTSSWHFPGWAGQVWDRAWPAAVLSRAGLTAYARHPLLRTVSLDRAFYRALDRVTASGLAEQVRGVAPGFRFVVKAPAALSDAVLRASATGAAMQPNPQFLDPGLATDMATALTEGLGAHCGVLVLQLSPLPRIWLARPDRLQGHLAACCAALRAAMPADTLLGVELRDPGLLQPSLAALLRTEGVRYVLGLHDRLPPLADQLPMLRAGWPGDLVCRWNLQRGQRYAEARDRWAPFDRLQAPDPDTRHGLARVMKATLDAGHRVFVTINNKAEGSAPASVRALAEALAAA